MKNSDEFNVDDLEPTYYEGAEDIDDIEKRENSDPKSMDNVDPEVLNFKYYRDDNYVNICKELLSEEFPFSMVRVNELFDEDEDIRDVEYDKAKIKEHAEAYKKAYPTEEKVTPASFVADTCRIAFPGYASNELTEFIEKTYSKEEISAVINIVLYSQFDGLDKNYNEEQSLNDEVMDYVYKITASFDDVKGSGNSNKL